MQNTTNYKSTLYVGQHFPFQFFMPQVLQSENEKGREVTNAPAECTPSNKEHTPWGDLALHMCNPPTHNDTPSDRL